MVSAVRVPYNKCDKSSPTQGLVHMGFAVANMVTIQHYRSCTLDVVMVSHNLRKDIGSDNIQHTTMRRIYSCEQLGFAMHDYQNPATVAGYKPCPRAPRTAAARNFSLGATGEVLKQLHRKCCSPGSKLHRVLCVSPAAVYCSVQLLHMQR